MMVAIKTKHTKEVFDDETKGLYKLTVQKHHSEEKLLHRKQRENIKDKLNKETISSTVNNFSNLKEQNIIIKNLQKLCDVTIIICLQKLCERLPKNIFIFAKKKPCVFFMEQQKFKALEKTPSDQCNLFQQKQTLLHVLNNCPV